MAFLAYLHDSLNILRDAVLEPSSEDSTWQVGNAVLLPLVRPYRTVEGQIASQHLNIHLQTPLDADTVAIVGHNFTSNAVVTLKGGTSPAPSGPVSESITVTDRVAWKAFTNGKYQYWRLEVDDPSNPDGFLQISYLMLGKRTGLSEGFLEGWNRLHEFRNQIMETEFGVPIVGLTLIDRNRLRLNFDQLNATRRDELIDFLRALERERNPLLVIPDPDRLETDEAFLGRLRSDISLIQNIGRAAVSGVEFEEEAYGRKIVDPLPTYTDGDVIATGFSRSTVAVYKDSDLKIRTATADEIRSEHWVSAGVRGTLLEPASANDWTRSEELGDAAWTKTNVTVTANAVAAPDDLVTADKLFETTATGEHSIARDAPTTTNDTLQAVSFFAKPDERTKVTARLTAKDASTLTAEIDLSAGTTANVSMGLVVHVESYGNSFVRVMLQYDVLSGGTTPQLEVLLMNDSDLISYAGDAAKGLYIWGLQWEADRPFPTSYMTTGAATASRDNDALQLTWDQKSQTLTAYIRMVDIGGRYTQVGSQSEMLRISDATVTSRLRIHYHGNLDILHTTSAGSVLSARPKPSFGQGVELLGQIYQDGSVQLHTSLGGAAPTSGTKSAALAIVDPWGLPGPMHVGFFNGTETTPLLIQRIILRRGVTSDFEIFRLGRFASISGVGVPWSEKPFGTFPLR